MCIDFELFKSLSENSSHVKNLIEQAIFVSCKADS